MDKKTGVADRKPKFALVLASGALAASLLGSAAAGLSPVDPAGFSPRQFPSAASEPYGAFPAETLASGTALNDALNQIWADYGFDSQAWASAAAREPAFSLDSGLTAEQKRNLVEDYFRTFYAYDYFNTAETCADRSAYHPEDLGMARACNGLLENERGDLKNLQISVPAVTILAENGEVLVGAEAIPLQDAAEAVDSEYLAPLQGSLQKQEEPVEEILKDWVDESFVAKTGESYSVPFELEEERPRLLTVSMPDEPYVVATILLRPDLKEADIVRIEGELSALGYSAYVGAIAGLASTPIMVIPTDIIDVLDTIAHEEEHGYLDVRPLGEAYGKTEEAATFNESMAVVVGGEMARYTAGVFLDPDDPLVKDVERTAAEQKERDDFLSATLRRAKEMYVTNEPRSAVNGYLMSRRDEFNREFSAAIRDMSMARLAIFARYTDNPTLDELERLRGCVVGGIKEFNETVSLMTTKAELDAAVTTYCGEPEGTPSPPPAGP